MSTKTVMVVEDDFDTLHPLAELLRIRGYAVVTASDAESAIRLARQSSPDLIITDIVLPGKSGLHFIERVRDDALLGSKPIIVISGCGPMMLIEAEAAGANFCLEKPIDLDLFFAALAAAIGSPAGQDSAEMAREERGRAAAGTIDDLVEKLRQCGSTDERQTVLKRLKKQILDLERKGRSRAV